MSPPPGQRIPILAYHSVSDSPPAGIAPYAVRPDDWARHLDLIMASGRTAITVSQLGGLLDSDAATRSVVITFDDGFEDNLTCAAPMLAARRLPATVFATTGFLAGRGRSAYPAPGAMLTWDGLADLEGAGIEVGAHGHSHRPLDELTRAAATEEIRVSKRLLEEALGHPVLSFAYPHGYADRSVEDEVRRSGFQCACGVRNAFSHPQDNRWRLARITVGASTTTDEVASWLRGSGAPVATRREQVRTTAWRAARRAKAGIGGAG